MGEGGKCGGGSPGRGGKALGRIDVGVCYMRDGRSRRWCGILYYYLKYKIYQFENFQGCSREHFFTRGTFLTGTNHHGDAR